MSMVFDVRKTAATAILNADLMSGEKFEISQSNRMLSSIAVVGSTAVGDFKCEFYQGENRFAELENSQAGAAVVPNKDDDVFVNKFIPRSSKLTAKVTNPAVANDVVIRLKFKPVRRRNNYRRNYNYRPYRRPYYRRYRWY